MITAIHNICIIINTTKETATVDHALPSIVYVLSSLFLDSYGNVIMSFAILKSFINEPRKPDIAV